MRFVQGLPQGVYVGQTKINNLQPLNSEQPDLAGLNLALHVHDEPYRVHQHRMQLLNYFAPYGVTRLTWLNQTHSTICHRVDGQYHIDALTGDSLVTSDVGNALMIMTADCLPIALGNADGTEIANLHAGWRGLANGVIEQTIQQMKTKPTWAWLGTAISQPCFEVGQEVKDRFTQAYGEKVVNYFQTVKQQNKYQADLYAIARYILGQQGIQIILGGEQCSYQNIQDYYSYRRNAKTGRMASFVFLGK
ncbi:peptidoglycan editing factor PgeF [Moraxella sp. ZY210820]|uniref:peptidoglycan editing factor PgeF n=1 Tax=unclassified Moraxella TaxID=2685852 RepID=UPI002731A3BF|nr:peptidoglycan editing factor PgeF [Moraxella sp. ZY210820]WLF85093.1 peptidoglycan editing factor PgeF [Moraxella sp. ZY210820]